MNFKIILPLFFLIFSFAVFSNDQIIAHNHDKSIVLTDATLKNWIATNLPTKYLDLDKQVESYFIEKTLLQQKGLISKDKIKQIQFNHNRLLYSNAFPIFKKDIVSKIKFDPIQYNTLLDDLKQKNKTKQSKVRLYQIFKKYPENANQKTKQEYYQWISKIKNSITDLESFKKVAQAESDSQSRLRMGLIGNVYQGLFPKKLNNIVMKMKAGELSEIIKTSDGVMLFYCEKHIPPNIMTLKEMEKAVENTILSHEKKVQWNQFNNEIADKLNIKIDWSKIKDEDPYVKVVTSKLLSLNKQQLEWLVNNKSIIKERNENKAMPIIKNYIVSHYLFNNLSDSQQEELTINNLNTYNNQIVSEVVYEKIIGLFKAPSQSDLMQHYSENKDSYKREQHYDISYIVFNLKDGNKSSLYEKANNVLVKLKSHPEKFDELAIKHQSNLRKLSKSKTESIARTRLASFFGLNVSKQIQLLKKYEISKLVESDNGLLWILRLNNIEHERLMTFDEAKGLIDKKLGSEILENLKNELFSRIISQQQIIVLPRN